MGDDKLSMLLVGMKLIVNDESQPMNLFEEI